MDETRKQEILDAIADTIRGLLRDECEEIFKSFTQSFQDHDGEGKFKYRLSISASIEPDGQGYDTQASLSYSVTKKAVGKKHVGDGQTDLFVSITPAQAPSAVEGSESEPAEGACPELAEGARPELAEGSKEDPLYPEALKFVLEQNGAALIELKKHLNIDFARAGQLIDRMYEEGIIGPYKGVNKREIIINITAAEIQAEGLSAIEPRACAEQTLSLSKGSRSIEGESKEPVLSERSESKEPVLSERSESKEPVLSERSESKDRSYYYNAPNGRVILFVDDGISGGEKWGTFYCKHGHNGSGSIKRLNSTKLPMKDNARDAQLDLDQFAIDHHLQECFEPTHMPPIESTPSTMSTRPERT